MVAMETKKPSIRVLCERRLNSCAECRDVFLQSDAAGSSRPYQIMCEEPRGAPAPTQKTTLSEPVYPNSEANGSYVKYTERLHKHIRPKLGEYHFISSTVLPFMC